MAALTLAFAGWAGMAASAQSTLPRDFERVHFARREVELDRMFSAAGSRLRDLAMRKVRHAVEIRSYADSLSGTRALRLAGAWATLSGFGEDDPACKERFDWFLLALPEIIDTEMIERDRVQVGEITRSIYPLLRPVVVADPEAPTQGRDVVHLTGRSVFGFAKPPGLELRFSISSGEDVFATKTRGDAEDPRGWLLYDLVESFPLPKGSAVGAYTAKLEIGRHGSWPRLGDPYDEQRFWHAPGYHQRAFEFFKKLQQVVGQRRLVDAAADDTDVARLAVLQEEILRPLLGREYLLRSWPTEALGEAMRLVEAILARDADGAGKADGPLAEFPPTGDRVFGIVAGKDELRRVQPLRVIWGPRTTGIDARLLVVLPPGGQDENYVIDGLGVDLGRIQTTPGAVVAFAHEPVDHGYFEGAMALLTTYFQVSPRRTSVVGILDGGTRARFAYPKFGGKLRELIFVGRELPDAAILGAEQQVDLLRVVSAYGYPSKLHVEKLLTLPNFEANKGRLAFDVSLERPRSLRESFEVVFDRTYGRN